MNYLAHLFFSDPAPLAWAGSLMGDFFKGSDFSALPAELTRHLKLHRHIDALTRSSPAFQRSRRRLDPRFRHGRSVLVDVFYDHFIACRWDQYHHQPLEVFAREVYTGLQSCRAVLSPGLQRQLPRMIAMDWLTSYRETEVVKRVLIRLEERLTHKLPLAQGFAELGLRRGALGGDFSRFMEETQPLVETWKNDN